MRYVIFTAMFINFKSIFLGKKEIIVSYYYNPVLK